MIKHDDRDKPMTADQVAIEVERLRQKLATPKPSESRRKASTLAAVRRMRPKP